MATTASTTAVRGRGDPAGRSGVAWVSTTLPSPSPSTIRITTVRGPGAANSARTGTPSRPVSRKATDTSRRSGVSSTTVRSVKEYGCSQDPCQGSRRLATTSSGSQAPIAVSTASTIRPPAGRCGTWGRFAGSPPRWSRRTHTSTPSSCAGYGAQAGKPPSSGRSPCQWHTSSPPATTASHSGAPRCGQEPGAARSAPSASRHSTISVPATVLPYGRPGRMPRLEPTTYQLPAGRAVARSRAAAIRAGEASRQVGFCSGQGVRRSRLSGMRRRSGRRFTRWPPHGVDGTGGLRVVRVAPGRARHPSGRAAPRRHGGGAGRPRGGAARRSRRTRSGRGCPGRG